MPGPEATFWKTLRTKTPKTILMERLENRVGAGVPDVYGLLDGLPFWLELKVIDRTKAKPAPDPDDMSFLSTSSAANRKRSRSVITNPEGPGFVITNPEGGGSSVITNGYFPTHSAISKRKSQCEWHARFANFGGFSFWLVQVKSSRSFNCLWLFRGPDLADFEARGPVPDPAWRGTDVLEMWQFLRVAHIEHYRTVALRACADAPAPLGPASGW